MPSGSPSGAGKAGGSDAGKAGCGARLARRIDGGTQRFFYRLGWAVGGHPWRTIALGLLIGVACSLGALQKETESRGSVVWTPTSSDINERSAEVQDAFGKSPRTSSLYIRTRPAGGNVLTAAALGQVVAVASIVRTTVVDASYQNGPSRSWTWSDLCYRRNGLCSLSSVADPFDYNTTRIDAAAAAPGGIPAHLASLQAAGQLRDVFGSPLILDAVLGDVTKDGSGNVQTAAWLRLQFRVDNRAYKAEKGGNDEDPPATAFETAVLDKIGRDAGSQSFTEIAVLPYVPAGDSEERSTSIRGDLAFVSSSIMLILVYLVVNLGNCSRVGSRVALSCCAGICVYLAVAISTGLGSLITFESNIHSVLPFLIAGIGVDDIFVMTHEFDLAGEKQRARAEREAAAAGKTQPEPPALRERLASAMASAGSSITLTSLTDIMAFTIGATTSLPGLRWFCVWAAIAVLAVFLITVTIFAALLVLDAQRQEAARMDFLCCARVKGPAAEARSGRGASACCCCCLRPQGQRRFFAGPFSKVLMLPVVKAIVVVCFLALAAGSLVSALNVKEEFRQEWFLPVGSYIQDALDVSNDHFSSFGAPVGVYATNVPLWASRGKLRLAAGLLSDNQYVDNGLPVSDWTADFRTYLQSAGVDYDAANQTFFEARLQTFLANPAYARFADSIAFESGSVPLTAKMTRFTGFYKKLNAATDEVNAMETLQSAVNGWTPAGAGAFAYSPVYRSWALLAVVRTEAVSNLALAVAAVFAVVLLFLADLVAALIVTLCVCLVLLSILGLMVAWGVALNSISVVNLVLSIGFAVDYSAHIAHSFLHHQGEDKSERARKALGEMGVSVFNGATSTLLAVAVLGLSKSYIFTVFFQMLFLSCTLGLAHGMILLPVLLSLLGPRPHPEVEGTGFGHSAPESEGAAGASGESAKSLRHVEVEMGTGSSAVAGGPAAGTAAPVGSDV